MISRLLRDPLVYVINCDLGNRAAIAKTPFRKIFGVATPACYVIVVSDKPCCTRMFPNR